MPQKPSVDRKILYNTLIQYQVFDEKGDLKSRSDKIWKDAATIAGLKADTLNFYVRENRWDLKIDLKKHFGIEVADESFTENDTSVLSNSSLNSESNNCETSICNKKCPEIHFNVDLTEEQWKSIVTISKIYREKKQEWQICSRVLQPGWTDVVAMETFLKTKSL